MKTLLLTLLLLVPIPTNALTTTELDTLIDTVQDYPTQAPFYSFLNHLVKKEKNEDHLSYLAHLFITSFSMYKDVVVTEIITIQGILIADRLLREELNETD